MTCLPRGVKFAALHKKNIRPYTSALARKCLFLLRVHKICAASRIKETYTRSGNPPLSQACTEDNPLIWRRILACSLLEHSGGLCFGTPGPGSTKG